MDEEKLIKEKLKAGKKKVKKQQQNETSNIIPAILAVIIQTSLAFFISKANNIGTFAMICYTLLTTFVIMNGLATYNLFKKKNSNSDNFLKTFYILSTIGIALVGVINKLGFLTWLLPILNFACGWYFSMNVPNVYLESTLLEYNRLNKLPKKAIIMELKKVIVLAIILALLTSLALCKIYSDANKEDEILLILIGSAIVVAIANLIVSFVLKFVSKRMEKVINTAFDVKLGTTDYNYSKDYYKQNLSVFSNFSTMIYRITSLVVCTLCLLVYTKLDISISILMITVYHMITMCYPKYTESRISDGETKVETTVANIYNSDGKQTGKITTYK